MSDGGGVVSGQRDDRYRVFVLRLWSDRDGRGQRWRCSQEDPSTRHRRGFPGLDELMVYLGSLVGDPGSEAREV